MYRKKKKVLRVRQRTQLSEKVKGAVKEKQKTKFYCSVEEVVMKWEDKSVMTVEEKWERYKKIDK